MTGDMTKKDIRAISLGNDGRDTYVFARRKGNKNQSLIRYNMQTGENVTIATFRDRTEAERFWKLLSTTITDYTGLREVVIAHMESCTHWVREEAQLPRLREELNQESAE